MHNRHSASFLQPLNHHVIKQWAPPRASRVKLKYVPPSPPPILISTPQNKLFKCHENDKISALLQAVFAIVGFIFTKLLRREKCWTNRHWCWGVCGGFDMCMIVIASLLFSIVFDSLHCLCSYLCHLPFRLTRSVANESLSDNIGCVLSFQRRTSA